MTTTPPDPTEAPSAAVPPPGCPAHGLDSDGIARLYGAEDEADAMGMYERLRKEHGAVAPVVLDGDLPAWLVLGYRENLEVARTATRYTRDSRLWPPFQEGRVPENSPLLPIIAWQPLCVFVDGTEHERLRAAVTESMARFDRRGIRRHVTRFANQLIDQFAADGQAEMVHQFAEHMPLLVLTHLLGMPDEFGPRLVQAMRDLIKGTATAVESNDYVVETLQHHVARKREAPGHDFTSWLMAHPADLTDDEVLQHLRLMLVAGNENTTILIANTLRMMLTDRRFRASLAGGHMTLPDAVEQLLWDEPPLMVCPARWSTGDVELAGQQIKTGDMLLLGLAAGNADPAVRPDLSVPMHGNRSHLAFSGGAHECPGQDIGRAITETAIDTLLMRLPDLHLSVTEDELTWVFSWMSRHLVTLPVQFTPRQPKAAPTTTTTVNPQTSDQPAHPTTSVGSSSTGESPESASSASTLRSRSSWWRSMTRWSWRR